MLWSIEWAQRITTSACIALLVMCQSFIACMLSFWYFLVWASLCRRRYSLSWLNYFDKCYVNGKVLNTRTRGAPRFTHPLFSPDISSVYQNNQEGYPRTQNKVKAWHRRWNILMENHIGVFEMIREIQKEQNRTEIKITQFIHSTDPSQNWRKNVSTKETNL